MKTTGKVFICIVVIILFYKLCVALDAPSKRGHEYYVNSGFAAKMEEVKLEFGDYAWDSRFYNDEDFTGVRYDLGEILQERDNIIYDIEDDLKEKGIKAKVSRPKWYFEGGFVKYDDDPTIRIY